VPVKSLQVQVVKAGEQQCSVHSHAKDKASLSTVEYSKSSGMSCRAEHRQRFDTAGERQCSVHSHAKDKALLSTVEYSKSSGMSCRAKHRQQTDTAGEQRCSVHSHAKNKASLSTVEYSQSSGMSCRAHTTAQQATSLPMIRTWHVGVVTLCHTSACSHSAHLPNTTQPDDMPLQPESCRIT
jgi:hypothetical protein